MRTHDEWLVALERQATLIDTLADAIDKRRENGEIVEISLHMFRGELKMYRRLLSQAPVDVLFEHSSTSAKSRHL